MEIDIDQFKFRDKEKAEKIIKEIDEADMELTLMHVCGTHQDTLVRHGLDPMLRDVGVRIRQGPGCPVCVTTQREIEEIIKLAEEGVTVTAFGDMMRVPGEESSLMDAKSKGADVRIVYSIDDAVDIAKKTDNEVVFMSVGFETTVPATANVISKNPPDNFSILASNRVIPPALKAILEMGEVKLDGLIEPGHVSVIIGSKPYEPLSEKYNIPQVVTGFEPLDLLLGVLVIVRQIQDGRAEVENEYDRVVKPDGNPKAKKVINEVFEPFDIKWRGFPEIPDSGLKLKEKYDQYSARNKFEDILAPMKDKEFKEPEGCRCGEVLRGLIESQECPLFGEVCNPSNPVGACMVSREGSCNIEYRYGSD